MKPLRTYCRCPVCSYDVSRSGEVCPECGARLFNSPLRTLAEAKSKKRQIALGVAAGVAATLTSLTLAASASVYVWRRFEEANVFVPAVIVPFVIGIGVTSAVMLMTARRYHVTWSSIVWICGRAVFVVAGILPLGMISPLLVHFLLLEHGPPDYVYDSIFARAGEVLLVALICVIGVSAALLNLGVRAVIESRRHGWSLATHRLPSLTLAWLLSVSTLIFFVFWAL